MIYKSVEDIKECLVSGLREILIYDKVYYADYPNYPNPGDHFIGLSTVKYLKDNNIEIAGISSTEKVRFDKPIVLSGGGNIGDLFFRHEMFRRNVIRSNPELPIIILPQSVFWKSDIKSTISRNIYNSHKNLTLITREDTSYKIAKNMFKCKIVKLPDMSWYLCDLIKEISSGFTKTLFRKDSLSLHNRDGGVWSHVIYEQFKDYPKECLFSLSILLGSMIQIIKTDFLETERLHGHILACMMNIPNKIIPVCYHKNDSTYSTWTQNLDVLQQNHHCPP